MEVKYVYLPPMLEFLCRFPSARLTLPGTAHTTYKDGTNSGPDGYCINLRRRVGFCTHLRRRDSYCWFLERKALMRLYSVVFYYCLPFLYLLFILFVCSNSLCL